VAYGDGLADRVRDGAGRKISFSCFVAAAMEAAEPSGLSRACTQVVRRDNRDKPEGADFHPLPTEAYVAALGSPAATPRPRCLSRRPAVSFRADTTAMTAKPGPRRPREATHTSPPQLYAAPTEGSPISVEAASYVSLAGRSTNWLMRSKSTLASGPLMRRSVGVVMDWTPAANSDERARQTDARAFSPLALATAASLRSWSVAASDALTRED